MSIPTMHDQLVVADQDEFSIADLLAALGREKRLFLGVLVIGSLSALAIALLVPRYFSASTLVLPPQQQQSAAAGALAQLGALAGVAGGAAGVKSPDEMYVAFLKTRRLQDELIKRFSLQSRYATESMMDTRAAMSSRVAVTSDKKTGLITIEVDDQDGAFAAELANAHVTELRKLLATIAVTEAQQRRLFFEQQVTKTQEQLSKSEASFRRIQAESGMVVSQALAESGVKAGIELRSQIAGREVQLQAMSRFATAQNPETQRLSAEISALKQQLGKIERGSGSLEDGGNPSLQGLNAVQAYRGIKVHEAALEALIKQFELAKLDEAKEGPLLQQVDVATAPERPTKPRRIMIVLGGVFLSVVAGAFLAITRAVTRTPGGASPSGWRKIRAAWF